MHSLIHVALQKSVVQDVYGKAAISSIMRIISIGIVINVIVIFVVVLIVLVVVVLFIDSMGKRVLRTPHPALAGCAASFL